MSGYGKGWHKIKNWNFKTIILGLAIRRMSNNGKIFLLAKSHCYQKILKCSRTLDFLKGLTDLMTGGLSGPLSSC